MNTALWLVQVLLAVAFGIGRVIKITRPISELAQAMVWPGDLPPASCVHRTAELSGAIGLLVPVLARIKPVLTPVAADALAMIMLLATAFHLTRGEYFALPNRPALGALAAFVAWGRLHRAPIAAR